MRILSFVICCGFFVGLTQVSQASLVLNEILADPSSGQVGDANNDGTVSSSEDEFLEFVNVGGDVINISGWSLSDSVRTRHVFLANTWLLPNQAIVVFGGGQPDLPSIKWQTATEGSLGLNNTGDTISVFDEYDQLILQMMYDAMAGDNQSIVLSPELSGSGYALHSQVSSQGNLFSPGTDVDGGLFLVEQNRDQSNPITIPEPVLFPLAMGLVGLFRKVIYRG
ncbi:MAG: lamin tail domain-containing protein [Candidatus Omnitrophica bacterium]|nr:lamin tail domain-containing protein [Candidatus Omnitrophota bacterium]